MVEVVIGAAEAVEGVYFIITIPPHELLHSHFQQILIQSPWVVLLKQVQSLAIFLIMSI